MTLFSLGLILFLLLFTRQTGFIQESSFHIIPIIASDIMKCFIVEISISIDICIYIHVYIYIYIYIYIHTHTHTHIYVCVYIYIHIQFS